MKEKTKENTKLFVKIIGLIFILAGFVLVGIYLFVETLNEIPGIWISGSIVGGVLLIIAKDRLVALIEKLTFKK